MRIVETIGIPSSSTHRSRWVKPGNIRAQADLGGGTLYCINAARYLFRDEPPEVVAVPVNSTKKLAEIDDRRSRFCVSITIVWRRSSAALMQPISAHTRSDIRVDPAYEDAEGLRYELTVNGKKSVKAIGKRGQFAAELLYFSDCIQNRRNPEPSGEEGMQDVRRGAVSRS